MKERDKDEAKRKKEAEKLDSELDDFVNQIERLNAGPRAELDQARSHMREVGKYANKLQRFGHDFARQEDLDQLYHILRESLVVAHVLVGLDGGTLENEQWDSLQKQYRDLGALLDQKELDRRELDAGI